MAALKVNLKRIFALFAVMTSVCLFAVSASAESFDDEDYEEYMSLPSQITADDCETVERLYFKLLDSENAEDYEDISSQLREKYVIARGIESEINYINMIIDAKLTPASEIPLSESVALENVIELGTNLAESDRQYITDWDGILKRQKELAAQKNIIYALGAIIPLAVAGTIFVCIMRKKKQKD